MRKVLDRLTGAQITVIAVAAIAAMVPGSLYAVAAFTNVAIQDPVTGYRAQVDQRGKMQVGPNNAYQSLRDAYDYYKHHPSYRFRVLFSADSNHVIYTVPNGYFSIIESLTGINTTANGGGFYLTTSVHGYLTGVFGGPVASVSQSFGSGAVLYPGETVSVDSRGAGNTGLFLHGYLIPTSISVNQANLEQQPAIQSYINATTKGLPKTKESPH